MRAEDPMEIGRSGDSRPRRIDGNDGYDGLWQDLDLTRNDADASSEVRRIAQLIVIAVTKRLPEHIM